MQRKGRELPADKHPNVPEEAKWLSGQGGGTWFTLTRVNQLKENEYRIRRHTPQGNLDCDRIFNIDNPAFDITRPFEIAHVSHCALVRVEQYKKIYLLEYLTDF